MRLVRFGLLILMLLSGVSAWAQQPATSQQSSSAQPASDPQAVAVVQAAITALGGATAIAQAQSWNVQAQMEGSMDNRLANESIDWGVSQTSPDGSGGTAAKSIKIPAWRTPRSLLIPEMVGALLVKESQDPHYVMSYAGQTTLASGPISVVVFCLVNSRGLRFLAQTFNFDQKTGLPVRVDISMPFRIGDVESFAGIVDLSDYRAIEGILYPFRIATYLPGRLPEIVTLQAVNASTGIPSNSAAGGAQ